MLSTSKIQNAYKVYLNKGLLFPIANSFSSE